MVINVEEVVIKYSDIVMQLAYQRLFNKSDSEDITQEVFIRLIKNAEKIKNEEHLKAWLIRVVINLCNDYNKSFWNKKTEELEENAIILDEKTKGILDEIAKLEPPAYRDIIYLYYYQGYKIKEIAQILNVSQNTVSSGLTRARNKLKNILEEEGM